MSRHGFYQPKIADEHIRNLYQWAKRLEVPMTHLLNTLLAHALVRLEHGVENVSEAMPEAYRRRKPHSEDKQENEFSVAHGFRIVSAYTTNAGKKIWIITEADRSATTILLPEEY